MKSPPANQSGAKVARTPDASREPGLSEPRRSFCADGSGTGVPPVRVDSHGRDARATTRFMEGLSPAWQLHEFADVTSTNLIAANLPAWHAVRADTQTAGRGRFQRQWVSDAGGLWLSAVLPVETNSPAWRMLPLATGVAVCDALRANGVEELRLRWPNDILVGERKLAGLLIDQFHPGLAVVGIGINVRNQPETHDGSLNGHVARLADLVAAAPSLRDLAVRVLASLQSVWLAVQRSGPEQILPRVNALWDLPRRVQLDLDGALVPGEFTGVDARGRLQLRLDDGSTKFFEPQEVKLLRDVSPTIP